LHATQAAEANALSARPEAVEKHRAQVDSMARIPSPNAIVAAASGLSAVLNSNPAIRCPSSALAISSRHMPKTAQYRSSRHWFSAMSWTGFRTGRLGSLTGRAFPKISWKSRSISLARVRSSSGPGFGPDGSQVSKKQ